jgi:hypothetical protein
LFAAAMQPGLWHSIDQAFAHLFPK